MSAPRAATRSRERSTTVALCGIGAALILLAASRTWATAVFVEEGQPRIIVEATGQNLASGAAGIGLVGLAGALALLATRRFGRIVTGLVLTAGGVFAAVQAADVLQDFRSAIEPQVATAVGRTGVEATTLDTSLWPWVTIAGGVLLAIGGVIAIVRGSRWPAFSRRYEAPGASDGAGATPSGPRARPRRPEPVEEDRSDALWKAQDRGEDPSSSASDDDTPPTGSARS